GATAQLVSERPGLIRAQLCAGQTRSALDSWPVSPDKPGNLRTGPSGALVLFENAARGCRLNSSALYLEKPAELARNPRRRRARQIGTGWENRSARI